MKCPLCGRFVPKFGAVKKLKDGKFIKICEKCAEGEKHEKGS